MPLYTPGSSATETSIGTLIAGATSKTTPIDADSLALSDSAASNILKKLTWANAKATLKTYFDTLYQAALVSGTNIKTINSTSLLGAGDIAISASGIKVGTGSTDPTAAGTAATGVGHAASAAANYSTALGANSSGAGSVATSGAGAVAVGGSYASGQDSFAAGGGDNSSSYGAKGISSIALGKQARAMTGYAPIGIGFQASATGDYSVALGGYGASASGAPSIAMGGGVNASAASASASDSIAMGDSALAAIKGKVAISASHGGFGSGANQFSLLTLRIATADATPTAATSTGSAADTTNQVILPNNATFRVSGKVVAMQKASLGTDTASYSFEALVRRGANAAATVLKWSSVTVDFEDNAAWDLAIAADTANGGLSVTVTGAATNIRTVVSAHAVEVIYA